jgi:hypothetical protein
MFMTTSAGRLSGLVATDAIYKLRHLVTSLVRSVGKCREQWMNERALDNLAAKVVLCACSPLCNLRDDVQLIRANLRRGLRILSVLNTQTWCYIPLAE